MESASPHLEGLDAENGVDYLPLTIRFSASIPDLLLDIPSPYTTTAAGLKQLIRSRLPRDLSTHRLRLIYAGRGLGDTVPLAVSLKLHLRSGLNNVLDKGKGKEPVRNNNNSHERVYVHCSIGDIVLLEDELIREAEAVSTELLLQQQRHDGKESGRGFGHESTAAREEEHHHHQQQQQQQSTTTPAPRGFDRLLSTGFAPAEISALRSQFLAILSVSRTPDTMPTGYELRELEDSWMDEGISAASAGLGLGVGGGGAAAEGLALGADDDGGFGTGSRGAVEDMLWGAVMGFFWPVGCVMWLRREEGVWSWRKGLAVFIGVVVNGAVGVMRLTG